MSLSIQNVAAYWATQTSLTSLVPASSVFLDVAADGTTLPYLIFSQVSQIPEWQTGGNHISRTRLRMTVYGPTLAVVSPIVDAIIAAFKWQDVTSAGFGCRLENIIPKGEQGGAFSCMVEWTLMESLS